MQVIKTPIIPHKQTFVKVKNKEHELDFKAICVFTALGFFLDDDTYWLDTKVLQPATINTIDNNGFLIDSKKWFQWHYSPREMSIDDATLEFTNLFETIIKEQVSDQKVILPLSGGLDSRTQAVALHKLNAKVRSYSYSFLNGYKESKISKKSAKVLNFQFEEYTIPKGYLWDAIDELAGINKCYSEFTHPRQMAVINEIAELGEVFSLGHWGDVLFDSDQINKIEDAEIMTLLTKKVIKKGGLELAENLWANWKIEGNFKDYLNERLLSLWNNIKIDDNSAKMRAFKSLYWAPRWTSINLAVFEHKKPITLPYYDDRMCEFICTIPESLLADRKIQIEYIKNNSKEAASVMWQDKRPFNLFTYHWHKSPYNLPYRIQSKLFRVVNLILGRKHVQRNWELQFLGNENEQHLKNAIFDSEFNESFISKILISKFYNSFKNTDDVKYSHSIAMLLTLATFFKQSKNNED